MPFLTACYLAIALVVMLFLTDRLRLQPFMALTLVTAAFGFAVQMSLSQIGNLFGVGFSLALQSLGLVIVAGSLMSVLAEQSGAADRLATLVSRWLGATHRAGASRRSGVAHLVTVIGTFAGSASTPGAAFAALMPIIRSLGRHRADGGNWLAVFLGLALSAGHGLLLPAPVVVAAMAILGAKAGSVFWIGLPLAFVIAGLGVVTASALLKHLAGDDLTPGNVSINDAAINTTVIPGTVASRVAAALVIASLLLVILLTIQSLADIPSEPFGGGRAREMLLGLGRPLVLLIVGPGLVLVALNRWSRDVVSAQGWLGRGLIQAAPIMLLVGAAGGFQRVVQETGMAALLGEKLLSWPLGLLLPFLVAAVIKSLQGSSLVASITAAGMIQPLLVNLGLDLEPGRSLAVLAIGIGSMTASHVNDPTFWLIGENARLRLGHALAVITLPMLIQGLTAILFLQIVGSMSAIW